MAPGYYWAVQLVLSQNLHSGDSEATSYTTALLDDLETVMPRFWRINRVSLAELSHLTVFSHSGRKSFYQTMPSQMILLLRHISKTSL